MWEPLKYMVAGIGGIAAFSLFAQFLTWNVLLDREQMEADAKRQKMEMERTAAPSLDGGDYDPCEMWGSESPQCRARD
jgi:hypothetical protein